MLMESFEVENFRSLKHLKLEKLARVNLLVGKNNSGKTSVLEAFFALFSIDTSHWLSIIDSERGLDNSKSDYRYIFYGFDINNVIRLSAIHKKPNSTDASSADTFNITIAANEQASLREREPRATVRRTGLMSLLIKLELPYSFEPITFELSRTDRNVNQLTPISAGAENIFNDGINFSTMSRYAEGEIITTSIDRSTLSEKIESIKFNKQEFGLLSVLRLIDSRIKSIELGSNNQIYFDLGTSFRTLLPLNLMGEGIQRLLDIISAMASRIGGVVMIDEIDNGLHYSALRILWKGILQAAREYDVQIFATTHSAEALRHLTWVLDDEENASYRDDVAAYTLIRADDDTVRSYRHDYEQLEYAIEHGIEVRN